MFDMFIGEPWASETDRFIPASPYIRMEVGSYYGGLCSMMCKAETQSRYWSGYPESTDKTSFFLERLKLSRSNP